jgi:salicylate hydroxylase
MLEFYDKWNPRVKKLLDCVPEGEVLEWKLCDHEPLATWVEDKVALLGDAAHPMLPYVAQGAAQAVEDGAVLGVCLSMIDSKDQINTALKVYELVRKERAETVQASATQTRQALHLHDGKEQQDRDYMICNASKAAPNPDLWSDRSFQQWCWVSSHVSFYIILISEYRAQTHNNKQLICGISSYNSSRAAMTSSHLSLQKPFHGSKRSANHNDQNNNSLSTINNSKNCPKRPLDYDSFSMQ